MVTLIELHGLPATDRVDVLREHMLLSRVPLELRPRPGAEISVRSTVADLGHVHLLSTRASGADIVRTARLARDATVPSLMMCIVERGSSELAQAGRVALVRAGEIVLYTTTEPYLIRFSPGAVRLTFQVSLERLGLPRRLIRGQVARTFGASYALAAVTAAFLQRVGSIAATSSASERQALEQPLMDLLRALLTSPSGEEPVAREALAESLGTRIIERMRMRIADPDLSVPSIAEEFGISTRYVYLVLNRMGIAFGDWVRERRIEAAAETLATTTGESMSISAIAHRWGFADHAHFTRAFRSHLGVTPTEWRRAAVAQGTR